MRKSLLVENLSVSIRGKALLREFNFSIEEGEKFAVLGLSGAGKSLLIEALSGNLPTVGSVTFAPHLNKKDCTFSYDQFGFLNLLKVGEVIQLLSKIYQCPVNNELIKRFRLNEIENNQVVVLSKGERKRLGVYSALFSNPKIVFLDEPTDGMDPIVRDVLWDILAIFEGTVMLTTHLWEEAEAFQDKVALMYRGTFLLPPMSMNELLETMPYAGKAVTDQEFLSPHCTKLLDHDGRRFHYFQNDEEKDKITSNLLSSPSSRNGYSILRKSLIDVYLLLIANREMVE